MSIIRFYLVLLAVTGGALAEIWEFGVDAPGSMIVDHKQGDFSLFEKTKEVRLKVPRCFVMEYVRVEVHNPVSIPTVRYTKIPHAITISYKSLQYSASTYSVIAKAARKPGCFNQLDFELGYKGKYTI
uniref:Uncharacterized protein n=1 Tax=Heliothis virescens TaxID=7102 RepID=A0A2A4K0L8_HELVI